MGAAEGTSGKRVEPGAPKPGAQAAKPQAAFPPQGQRPKPPPPKPPPSKPPLAAPKPGLAPNPPPVRPPLSKPLPQPPPGNLTLAQPHPIKMQEGPAAPVRPEVSAFARGMVQAADAAAQPGPTTDSDLLPRESVTGLFVRDFALRGSQALGRPPLEADEAGRVVVEKHTGGRAGVYYDTKVAADGPDAFVVKVFKLEGRPPFLPEKDAEASYRIDRKSHVVMRLP